MDCKGNGRVRIVKLRVCISFVLLFLTLLSIPVYAADFIVPDDYSSIQDAINAANDGDTIIVRDGTYSVYLNITKSIMLRSKNGSTNCILQASTSDDVIEVHADRVNITGFTIRNGQDDGIDIEPLNFNSSDHVNISNNVFYNLYGGIQIEDSNYTVIVNNVISNTDEGIYVVGSSYFNLIVNNTISNSTSYGIDIPAGDGSEIYLNKFTNNTQNAWDCGNNHWNSTEMHWYTYQGNIFTNFTGNYWDDYTGVDSVKLYVNRGIFNEGQEVIVEHMLTGKGQENGTLIISLEDPDGQLVYLPMLSEKQEGREYDPIRSDYSIPFNQFVNNWREGTYILRSNPYNESGELLDDDIVTFEVCRKTSTLQGSYLRRIEDNDNSSFFLSRIRLIDFYTLKTNDFEFKGVFQSTLILQPSHFIVLVDRDWKEFQTIIIQAI